MLTRHRVSAPLATEDRKRLVDALATWNFKPHRLDNGDLYRVATLLFEAVLASEGIAELGIQRGKLPLSLYPGPGPLLLLQLLTSPDQMNRLLFAIRAIYHAPNPYHNYVHAIDVLQATYSFLMDLGLVPPYSYLLDLGPNTTSMPWKRPGEEQRPVCGAGTRRARDVMRPQDVLAVLIAAMGHDVGHPGLSNAFMVSPNILVLSPKVPFATPYSLPQKSVWTPHSSARSKLRFSLPTLPSTPASLDTSPDPHSPSSGYDADSVEKRQSPIIRSIRRQVSLGKHALHARRSLATKTRIRITRQLPPFPRHYIQLYKLSILVSEPTNRI